jgi:hypothetical protein
VSGWCSGGASGPARRTSRPKLLGDVPGPGIAVLHDLVDGFLMSICSARRVLHLRLSVRRRVLHCRPLARGAYPRPRRVRRCAGHCIARRARATCACTRRVATLRHGRRRGLHEVHGLRRACAQGRALLPASAGCARQGRLAFAGEGAQERTTSAGGEEWQMALVLSRRAVRDARDCTTWGVVFLTRDRTRGDRGIVGGGVRRLAASSCARSRLRLQSREANRGVSASPAAGGPAWRRRPRRSAGAFHRLRRAQRRGVQYTARTRANRSARSPPLSGRAAPRGQAREPRARGEPSRTWHRRRAPRGVGGAA